MMALAINRLSALGVKTEKRPGRHADGLGLYLSVSPNGGRRWVFIFKRGSKSREMGLGSAATVSLARARTTAGEARALLARGLDPIAERKAARLVAAGGLTFEECAGRYIEAHKAGWRNAKHAAQWESTLRTYAYPTIGALPVAAVGTTEIVNILEPIWSVKPETASRVRGRIESVLDWAKARGFREGENPARWRGHLDQLLPARSKVRRVRHHPALPYPQVAAFMSDLRQRESSTSALALEFSILTVARTSETIGATAGEIDMAGKLWMVPGERMKGGRPHTVPLSRRAFEIARDALSVHGATVQPSAALFVGNRPDGHLSNGAMLMLLDGMGRGDLTTHGFRSTFRDWAAECTNFPSEVVEMALAHVVRNKSEAAYRRGDLLKKRALLMEAWANYCASAGKRSSVVPLVAAAR